MKKIVIVASSIYYLGDGYKTRIDTEIERLNRLYDITLFIPKFKDKCIEFPQNITIEEYPTNYHGRFHFLYNNYSFFKRLNILLKKYGECIVIGESLVPAIKTYRISKNYNCKFVFDCHGTEPSEFKLNNPGIKGSLLFILLRWLEKKVVKNSDLIVTVTKKQFDYFKVQKDNVVFPMMPTERFLSHISYREEIRNKLDINDDELVFVYSGQNQKWQMCEEICDLYRKIRQQQTDTRLLILTGCVDYFEELVQKKEIENAVVLSVPYEEMPRYLDACDYGFCIRNSSIINQFASPTKVLEYVSRNVSPILSDYVGDFSLILPKEDLAYVVSDSPIPRFKKNEGYMGTEYVKKMNKIMSDDYKKAIKSLES